VVGHGDGVQTAFLRVENEILLQDYRIT